MTGKLAVGPHPRNGPGGGPGDYDILVLDASMKQSLASVRSLGRAGLRVAAGESIAQRSGRCRSALRSRYCQRSLVLPDLVNDTPAFIAAVTEFVRDHAPRVVLPTGDVTIGVLRCHREELAELGCVLALAPEAALDIANDKDLTLTAGGAAGHRPAEVAADRRRRRPRGGGDRVWLPLRAEADNLVDGRDGGPPRPRRRDQPG